MQATDSHLPRLGFVAAIIDLWSNICAVNSGTEFDW